MFCIHCGADGAKNYCAKCGTSQALVDGDKQSSPRPESKVDGNAIILADAHWTEVLRYETVLAAPEARSRIAACATNLVQGLNGEDLLAVFDAVSSIGFSLKKFTTAILPVYDKLGIKTCNKVDFRCAAKPGHLLLATLCAFAAQGLKIDGVQENPDVCCLTAQIPSSMVTNRGLLQVILTARQDEILVEISVTISGQWYDWGKSQALANAVRTRILQDASDQSDGQPPRLAKVA